MAFITVDKAKLVSSKEEDYADQVEVDIPELSDSQYQEELLNNFKKCLSSKNKPTQVDTYHNYSPSKPRLAPRGKTNFPSSYMSASFFMTAFNLKMTESFKVISTINSFNKRGLDRSIVYRDKPLDPYKVPVNVRDLFNNTTVTTENNTSLEACIIQEDKLLEEMKRFLTQINDISPNDYTEANVKLPVYKPLIKIQVDDFLKMSTGSRLRILGRTVNVYRNVLSVSLNIKKEIGNLGREYHLFVNVPRPDRAKISNLYGYDFESALQTIVLAILRDIAPKQKFGITANFVANKNDVRKHVVDVLGVDIDTAKRIITAAYQGGGINGMSEIVGYRLLKSQKEDMDGLHTETKSIINELIKISSNSFKPSDSTIASHYKAAHWYASKRTKQRWEMTQDFSLEFYEQYRDEYGKSKAFKYAKSYMFYLWTYFEGEARKIVQQHLKQPITLHDAVYTQNKASYDAMVVKTVEDEIEQKLGIPLKLGKA